MLEAIPPSCGGGREEDLEAPVPSCAPPLGDKEQDRQHPISDYALGSEVINSTSGSSITNSPSELGGTFAKGQLGGTFAKGQRHSMRWDNLTLSTLDKSTSPKKILDGVSGMLHPASMTALMGHSGSGKTTLLSILGRQLSASSKSKMSVKGSIVMNGKDKPSLREYRSNVGFLEQKDSLYPTSTPREAITFSARLRNPMGLTNEQIGVLVDRILSELGLVDVADNLIGGNHFRGLSGGEQRRVSLGVELVVHPKVLLADEPISGLDSHSALQVLDSLTKVAKGGASVLVSVHQPTFHMLRQFDQVILMRRGCCFYHGPTTDLSCYFAERGYPVPSNCNLADWVIDVLQQAESNKELEEKGFLRNGNSHSSQHLSVIDRNGNDETEELFSQCQSKTETLVQHQNQTSVWLEIKLLVCRDLLSFKRDSYALILRAGFALVGGTFIGVVLQNVAKDSLSSPSSFASHVGAVFSVTFSTNMSSQAVLHDFECSLPVTEKEYSTGHYRLVSRLIAQTVVEAMGCLMQLIIFAPITYYLIGFGANVGLMFAIQYTFCLMFSSIAVVLGLLVRDVRSATEIFPLMLVPQMLLCGFIVAVDDLPQWLQWSSWAMPFTYAFRLMLAAEFSVCEDEEVPSLCSSYLSQQRATSDYQTQYWSAVCAMYVFFRVLSFIMLRHRVENKKR